MDVFRWWMKTECGCMDGFMVDLLLPPTTLFYYAI